MQVRDRRLRSCWSIFTGYGAGDTDIRQAAHAEDRSATMPFRPALPGRCRPQRRPSYEWVGRGGGSGARARRPGAACQGSLRLKSWLPSPASLPTVFAVLSLVAPVTTNSGTPLPFVSARASSTRSGQVGRRFWGIRDYEIRRAPDRGADWRQSGTGSHFCGSLRPSRFLSGSRAAVIRSDSFM